jgi:hypothetical protein
MLMVIYTKINKTICLYDKNVVQAIYTTKLFKEFMKTYKLTCRFYVDVNVEVEAKSKEDAGKVAMDHLWSSDNFHISDKQDLSGGQIIDYNYDLHFSKQILKVKK